MKKLFLFAIALIALAGCEKDAELDDTGVYGKEYVVNLGFSGEEGAYTFSSVFTYPFT